STKSKEENMSILLTGGTGKTSLRIARLLSSAQIPHILASRSNTAPSTFTDAQPCRFDWNDSSTWASPWSVALDIKAVWLVAPSFVEPIKVLKPFVEMAREKGCQRFVLLSGSPVKCGEGLTGEVHAYLKELGDKGEKMIENLSESAHLLTIRNEGKLYSATGKGKIPWVSAEDIAAVAYRALVDKQSHNCDQVVLGNELLSYGDVADILSDVLGKSIVHDDRTEQEIADRFTSFGLPEEYAKLLARMDTKIKQGGEEYLNDTVETVTGRPPKTFGEFAKEKKGVWL
ncbi:MAG: hypothetical protein Q9177_005030, partial [Variospora cf. flavescens]